MKYKSVWAVFSINPDTGVAFIREFIRYENGNEEEVLFYRAKPPYQQADIILDSDEVKKSFGNGFVKGNKVVKPHEFSSYPSVLVGLAKLRRIGVSA